MTRRMRDSTRGAVNPTLLIILVILALIVLFVVVIFAQAFALAVLLIIAGLLIAVLVPPWLGPVLGAAIIIIGAVLFFVDQAQSLSLDIFKFAPQAILAFHGAVAG